jgi:hypothetical protein
MPTLTGKKENQMKKSILLMVSAVSLMVFNAPASAEQKVMNFVISNTTNTPYEITLSTKKKKSAGDLVGCLVRTDQKANQNTLECTLDDAGNFPTTVATFQFAQEGPTLLISQEGFSILNNGSNNLASVEAKADSANKWPASQKVAVTLSKASFT